LTDTVVFSDDFDNIGRAAFTRRAGKAVTGVVVGGPGEGANREMSSATASGWSQALHVEDFVNGSNFKTDAARQNMGARRIAEMAERQTLTFEVQQTQGMRYGRDYGLGDLVTRRAFGNTQAAIIDETVTEIRQNGRETIRIGFGVLA
jgi:hypothetical protein